jgi:hypothetical protein
MLRYINKQLSKKELHEVEKHMLDCELCSDAYEGMKFAQNSSMLFAIDNKIDQRVRGGGSKSHLIKNLMVAASVIVIVLGAYFTFNNFDKNLSNQSEMAVTEGVPQNDFSPVLEEKPLKETLVENEEKNNIKSSEYTVEVKSEITSNEQQKNKVAASGTNKGKLFDESDNTIVDYDQDATGAEEISQPPVVMDVEEEATESVNARIENTNENTNRKDVVTSANNGYSAVGNNKNEEKSISKKKSKTRNNKAPSAPTTTAMDNVVADSERVNEREQSNTYTLYTYTVYDYSEEYQNDYDFKKSVELQTVTPDFANDEDKELAEKELEKSTIEISYKETLELGIKNLKNNNFQLALNQFDIILITHPKDINALFYSGISFYNMNEFQKALLKFDEVLRNKNTAFKQEAEWYKALSFIEIKDNKSAKKILQKVIDADGFYKTQAEEKLRGLK